MGSGRPDGGTGGLALVAAEVVQDDDVARREGRDADIGDVALEDAAVDRSIDDPGGP